MSSNVIETERLILRPPRLEDFEPWAEMMGDEQTARFIGGVQPPSMAWRGVMSMAGAWQLTPLKQGCLVRCRSPVEFLTRHHRSGPFGLGLRHGLFCLGCCWALMLLLFVGGVMNLAWVGGIALFVLLEKTIPPGRWLGHAAGVGLILWGGWTLIAAA